MFISEISLNDKILLKKVDELLKREGLERDSNLDYICAVCDEDYNIKATGSCFRNTLRCVAVDSKYQGQGILNLLISHLIEYQINRGNLHLFIYTKVNTSKFFEDLGFYEIARVGDDLVFLENKKNGFSSYLEKLKQETNEQKKIKKAEYSNAIIMNANPFTLGHLYLVEQAIQNNDLLHLFIVKEDISIIPFEVRKKLVIEGTRHLQNIIYHDTDNYIVSSATFPSYFLKDSEKVIYTQATLDTKIFKMISEYLNIKCRYLGDEPFSKVTNIYNKVISENLNCKIIPRKQVEGFMVSASFARECIKNRDFDKLKKLVPESTYKYFLSENAEKLVEKIVNTQNVWHY